jgi:hypothetical protein
MMNFKINVQTGKSYYYNVTSITNCERQNLIKGSEKGCTRTLYIVKDLAR